jgi:hypothetical protein
MCRSRLHGNNRARSSRRLGRTSLLQLNARRLRLGRTCRSKLHGSNRARIGSTSRRQLNTRRLRLDRTCPNRLHGSNRARSSLRLGRKLSLDKHSLLAKLNLAKLNLAKLNLENNLAPNRRRDLRLHSLRDSPSHNNVVLNLSNNRSGRLSRLKENNLGRPRDHLRRHRSVHLKRMTRRRKTRSSRSIAVGRCVLRGGLHEGVS